MRDVTQSQPQKKRFGLLPLFFVTHFWWILLAITAPFCTEMWNMSGDYGSCTIPIKPLASFLVLSTFFIVPPFLPIIFYIQAAKRVFDLKFHWIWTFILFIIFFYLFINFSKFFF